MTSSRMLRLAAPIASSFLLSCAPQPSPDAGSDASDDDAGAQVQDAGGDAGTDEPLACAAPPSGAALGSAGDLQAEAGAAARRVALMGGGVEVDRASALFVEGALGGDVLVLRASGSVDSYTSYFASELSTDPAPASVTTIRLDDPAVGDDEAVLCRVDGAEALWLAGGDQYDYLGRWPDALHGALASLHARGGAIGGTSAGAMALSGYAFDAAEGGVTSEEALGDPSASFVRAVPSPFAAPELSGFLVDTHFVARGREGRLLAFLARVLVDHGEPVAYGIGLDESAALVIEGGRYRALADGGATVLLYEVIGPATISTGAALSLEGIRRAVLHDGDEGDWPPDFDLLETTALTVTGGVVEP